MLWHAAFMTITVAVVAAGVARGIERASRILMPVLAAMVILLAGYVAEKTARPRPDESAAAQELAEALKLDRV